MNFSADLQAHFFQNADYGLGDVLKMMEKRGLSALASLGYVWEPTLWFGKGEAGEFSEAEERYEIESAGGAFIFTNRQSGRQICIIAGEEVAVEGQKWHFLAIGVTGIRTVDTPEGIIEEIWEKGGLPIIDHPFADPAHSFRDIDKEKERELVYLCRRYAGKIALEWNGYCLPLLRRFMPGYTDVNRKVEELAEEFNIPLVPTTDLHARNKRLLKAMGTAFIKIPAESVDIANLRACLRKNVLSFNFVPCNRYVSFAHFVEAFGMPRLRRWIY